MVQKRQLLATKADLKKLATAKELKNLEKRMDARFEKIDGKFEQLTADLTQHMNVVAENLVYDFKGIFKDRLEQHEDRITHLEKHTGLVQV